jgi:hypothetical protein
MTREEALIKIMADDEMRAWVESRPEQIRAMVKRVPPGTWWRMSRGVGIYTPVSYAEDGTLTVHKHDPMLGMNYQVFGVNPDSLTWTPLDPSQPAETFWGAFDE